MAQGLKRDSQAAARTRWDGKLSPAQRRPLEWLSEKEDRQLYGPMSNGMGGQRNYGGAGGALLGRVLLTTGNRLLSLGLIQHVKDKYPLGYYEITEAGRHALKDA
jgi:hypothetical protein